MRRLGVLGAMVVVVALLVWAGVHNLRQRRLAMQQARQSQITVVKDGATSSASGDSPDAQGASLRGKPAPAFTLVDLSGKKVSLADYKGHAVVVNFWATWCGPCKLEMPWFEEFSGKYKSQGLVMLGLSQDQGASKDDIADAAKKIGVTYQILLPDDNEKVSKAYGGVDYLPETFYVDKNGNVVEETAGAPSKDEMEANIRKTLAVGGM
ncbi:TlpA family protein disulfide reductase [Granulicella mallensis]|uniref:Alkyl hydroperoxide reductase/ Thiol specific antioxidant/ Mal allergen n=1 Tax=Granulicella mallensis (strain ATCC BAA-1857 / DSM 23137 / MP5ACTX8) TaxID=682795 RepID=G8P254_GRAMM|nr:TlpA disulfide reductase family protein [Granulicella mallensis]AEU38200.1 alkyl hydroperoxide reductase/ Thiol specific antioxidant/ Mal allergen [Granulicella mallensis MP5ACTX8]